MADPNRRDVQPGTLAGEPQPFAGLRRGGFGGMAVSPEVAAEMPAHDEPGEESEATVTNEEPGQ